MGSEPRARKPYPTDVTDEGWAFVAPYLTLMDPDAPQRRHDLRAILRWAAGRADDPTAVILDSRTVQSTPESGARAEYDGHKRRKGSKTHAAVDTLGHLVALHVTPASAQERDQVGVLAAAVQGRPRRPWRWRSSTRGTPGPSAASSCCRGGGSSRAASPGPRASAAWPATTNGCRKPSPDCTSSPLPA
jgi:transposase